MLTIVEIFFLQKRKKNDGTIRHKTLVRLHIISRCFVDYRVTNSRIVETHRALDFDLHPFDRSFGSFVSIIIVITRNERK